MKHFDQKPSFAQNGGVSHGRRRLLLCSWEDPQALENYLDRLAVQGWELQAADGFFSGVFVPTRRTELRYLVCFAGRHTPEEGELCRLGWEPVGFCRGMYICRSLSCRDADREQTVRELKLPGSGRGVLSAALLLLLWLALLLIPGPGWGKRLAISLLGEGWLSSQLGVLLWLLLPAELIGQAAARLLSLVSSLRCGAVLPAQISGGLDIVFTLLIPGCALPLILLDLSGAPLLFLLLCLALAAASLCAALFLRRRVPALPALLALLAVVAGLLLPNVEGSSTTAVSLPDFPVVRCADLGGDWGGLSCVTYSRSSSLFMTAYDYQELREAGQLQCRVYRCINGSAARQLLSLLVTERGDGATLSTLSGEVYLIWDGGGFTAVSLTPCELGFDESWLWTGGGGSILLLRQGRTVAVVSGGVDWTEYAPTLKCRLGLE